MFSSPVLLNETDETAATAVLVEAFTLDPILEWLLPGAANDVRRARAGKLLTGAVVRVCVRFGWCFGTRDSETGQLIGVLCALPPESAALTATNWTLFWWRMGRLFRLRQTLGIMGMKRFRQMEGVFDDLRLRLAPPRHVYVLLLGVSPQLQRKGIGSALLETCVTRSRLRNLPVYLETETAPNVDFYRKNGFHTLYHGQIAADSNSPNVWTMVR